MTPAPIADDCLRCGGPTEEGFLVERGRNFPQSVKFEQGAPEEGWFGVRLHGRDPLPVTVRRCTRCGRLELYVR